MNILRVMDVFMFVDSFFTLSYFVMSSPGECAWDVYNEDSLQLLGYGLYTTGVFSLILSALLVVVLLKSSLTEERSFLSLRNLCAAGLVRTWLYGFLLSGSSALNGRWSFGENYCTVYGFFKQFVSVYQIEALTHLCIERYVHAKYIKNGWEMSKYPYLLFTFLCWAFSIIYSLLPFAFGASYGLDFSCTSCALDLVLPSTLWKAILVVVLLFFQSVKPVFFMAYMLHHAIETEVKYFNQEEHRNQLLFTQTTLAVTITALVCWTPTFLVTGWLVLMQLWGFPVMQPPLPLALAAAWGSELNPGAIALTILCSNEQVRQATRALFGKPAHIKYD